MILYLVTILAISILLVFCTNLKKENVIFISYFDVDKGQERVEIKGGFFESRKT